MTTPGPISYMQGWDLEVSIWLYGEEGIVSEKGEMSWVSLAQVMMGGGKLFTSHGRVTSSPARTEISTGLSWDGPLWSPNTLGLTKTNTSLGREIIH